MRAEAILSDLCEAEKDCMLGSRRGCFVSVSRLAERLLAALLETLPEAEQERSRKETWGRGRDAPGKPGLGALLSQLDRAQQLAGTELVDPVSLRQLWTLNDWRNGLAHATSAVDAPGVDQARGVLRGVLVPLILRHGLADEAAVRAQTDRARREILRADSEAWLELDRRAQKGQLHHALSMRQRKPLLALLVDGEHEQGHEALASVAALHARQHFKWSEWRPFTLRWDGMPPNPGVRLGMVLARLAGVLGVDAARAPMDADPLARPGAWEPFVDDLRGAALAAGETLFVRHVVKPPRPGDELVLREYLRRVWVPLEKHRAWASFVLTFELVREEAGFWLTPSWWRAFAQRRCVRRVRTAVLGNRPAALSPALALEELRSVPEADLVEWIAAHTPWAERAEEEARGLLAWSRGGRFELLVRELNQRTAREGTPDRE